MHNHRIALVRIIQIWNQIAFPSSLAVFGVLFATGVAESNILSIYIGAILATAILIVAKVMRALFDKRVVELYPRIVALELALDYNFYRTYLKRRSKTLRSFVDRCEKELVADDSIKTVEDLWIKVKLIFDAFERDTRLKRLMYSGRNRGLVPITATWIGLVLIYWGIVAWVTWQGDWIFRGAQTETVGPASGAVGLVGPGLTTGDPDKPANQLKGSGFEDGRAGSDATLAPPGATYSNPD